MRRSIPLLAAGLIAGLGLAGAASAGTAFRMPPPAARPASTCAPGSYSVVNSPDGTSVSILFNDLSLASDGTAASLHASCTVSAPLHLPDGYSLGLYRVDYRGFAHLPGGAATLGLDYALGPPGRLHSFIHGLTSPQDGEFSFSETLPPGLMKRVGCGEQAFLTLTASLNLLAPKGSQSMVTLDSVDGGPAVTYRFDLRKCSPGGASH